MIDSKSTFTFFKSVQFFSLFTVLSLFLTGCQTTGTATSSSDYTLVEAPTAKDILGVHHYQLDNGLDIYLMENDQEPRFYAEIAVRTGSRNDPAENTGLAHYLEHLLFKGTDKIGTINYAAEKPHLDRITELYELHFNETDPEKRKEIYEQIDAEAQLASQYQVPSEFNSLYQQLGAQALNAHTWRDETVYKVDLPANRLRNWAAMEAERYRNPVFRLFHTELQTVYEEKNRALDNKGRIIFDSINEALFQVHPYGQQTTLGDADHLRSPRITTIKDYFDTYYVPNNMAIVISGDINVEETVKIISDYFSYMEPGDIPEPPEWNEPPLDEVRRVELQYPGEEEVQIAFRTKPVAHPDRAALQILDMILDNQTAGLINLNLNQAQKVRRAGSYPLIDVDHGTQYLYGVPKEGQTLEEVEQLLLDQIELIKAGEFEDWLIDAIVNDFFKTEQLSLEQNTTRVSKVRDAFIAGRPWSEAQNDLAEFGQVTKEDVVRVANEYFGDGYVVAYRRDGEYDYNSIEPPEITSIELQTDRSSEFAQSQINMSVNEIEPDFVEIGTDVSKTIMDDGRPFYYTENPMNELFEVRWYFDLGTNQDHRLPILASLLDKSGYQPEGKDAERVSAEELKKQWYRLGADFSFSPSDNELVVTLSGINSKFDETLELAKSFLSAPSPDEGALEEYKQILLKQREDVKKDPGSVMRAASWYSRYAEDSPLREDMTNTQVKEITEQELLELFEDLLATEHSLGYVGRLNTDEAMTEITTYFPAPDVLRPSPPWRVRDAINVEENELMMVELDTVQTQVRIEGTGPVRDREVLVPSMMFNEYFSGGMSGIVFQQIREARGLAYSAGARYIVGSHPGEEDLMIQVAGTQAENTNDALNEMIRIMEELPQEPERFTRAKESVEARMRTTRIGFRGLIDSLRRWERLGYDDDPSKILFEKMLPFTFEQMLEFHDEYIEDKPWRVVIVGNEERLGELDFASKAEVKKINVDEIFPKE